MAQFYERGFPTDTSPTVGEFGAYEPAPGNYPVNTGNAWADTQYGPLLSPSEKANAERAYKNVGKADWNISHESKQALEGFDSMAQERVQKVGINRPGTPDWIKAKFPGDPKGAVIAPAYTGPSRVGAGPSAFELDPNYGRPRSAETAGLTQYPASRYRFRDDTIKALELRGDPPPTYTPAQAMTPSQNLAEIDRKRDEQIAADRVKAMVSPEQRTYPTDLMGGEKIPPELKVMPTSKMTPAQIADAQAGYQRIMDDARQPEGYRVRAKNLLTRADAAFPEAVKQQEGHTTRLKALYDEKRAQLNAQFFPKGGGLAGLPSNNTPDQIRTQMNAANESFQKAYRMSLFTPDEIDSWAAQSGARQQIIETKAAGTTRSTVKDIYGGFLNDAYDKDGDLKSEEELARVANAYSIMAKESGYNVTPEKLLEMIKAQPAGGTGGEIPPSADETRLKNAAGAAGALKNAGWTDLTVVPYLRGKGKSQEYINEILKNWK